MLAGGDDGIAHLEIGDFRADFDDTGGHAVADGLGQGHDVVAHEGVLGAHADGAVFGFEQDLTRAGLGQFLGLEDDFAGLGNCILGDHASISSGIQ